MQRLRPFALTILGATATFSAPVDLGTYSGCAASDADFQATTIYSGIKPLGTQDPYGNIVLKIAFDGQGEGAPDVYFVHKYGTVRRYNGHDGSVDSLGTIPVDYPRSEYGLLGIAARGDFRKDPWLYFYYSFTERAKEARLTFRISRIRLRADFSKLDMPTEKVLLKIDVKPGWNTGGAMQFDAYGDLWIAVGDDMVTDEGAGNTADLRGGILRIHPDESAKGYSIPAGNFAQHFQAYYTAKGMADIAALYADTAVVKPELYVKGTDNAYTLTLDPVRRWATWGDVGPDQGKVSEEYNLVKEPVFAGWPYFAGEEDMTGIAPYPGTGPIGPGSTKAAPVNGQGLGVKTLPPVADPIFARHQACAMTGPILRYDGSISSAGQWPPQLDRKWLISGCDAGYGWHLLTLDSAGEHVLRNERILDSIKPATLVDIQQGPDGRVYYVDYGKGTINRIDYSGSCKDAEKIPERTGCADPAASNFDPSIPKAFHDPRLCAGPVGLRPLDRAPWARIDGSALSVSAPGPHRAEILDLRGKRIASFASAGPATHALPSLPAGLYRLRVRSDAGQVQTAFPCLGP